VDFAFHQSSFIAHCRPRARFALQNLLGGFLGPLSLFSDIQPVIMIFSLLLHVFGIPSLASRFEYPLATWQHILGSVLIYYLISRAFGETRSRNESYSYVSISSLVSILVVQISRIRRSGCFGTRGRFSDMTGDFFLPNSSSMSRFPYVVFAS
jgi:hypothetical protein